MSARLICVSNRVALPQKTDVPGGLAVGVLGALKHTGGVWFGWGGELTDGEPGPVEIQIREGVTYATFDLRREQFHRYYNGYSNDALWPLFHYMPSKFRFKGDEHDAYQEVNRRFASQLAPLLKDDDVIWVHDYHLIPLACRLRELGVRCPIGFFLHIPFPHIEVLRVLPTYAELVKDLASYDVVGFQSEPDLESFMGASERIFGSDCIVAPKQLNVGGRRLTADVFPIGVDVAAIQEEAIQAAQNDVVRRLTDSLLGRKLMIGADRLDYSKGLVERFAAYEQFLAAFPENRGRITYLQIAPLSRKDVQSYVEIRRALEQAAGRTNGKFADTDWTPIRYVNRNYPREVLMGLLRVSNVGLVTPLRDGMNLVAKEFLAAQDPEDPGVLVLSTFAGAARELSAALIVNPYDTRAVGHAIQTALTMPLVERRERHAALLTTLAQSDIHRWVERFIAALRHTTPIIERGRIAGGAQR
ncbi:MAG TPA: trehalose-6-phosphate synthase [Steroidobacteraceae bacterium]|nr:trehalose-6-phosphate synthase [Steroidobacteraceae bacterium]